MKKIRVLTSAFMIVLMAAGGMSEVKEVITKDNMYTETLESAEENVEKGLYQIALEYYEEALNIKESEDVRKKYLEIYEECYSAGLSAGKDYVGALTSSTSVYPKDPYYYVKLAEYYIEKSDYKSALSACNKGIANKVNDELLNSISKELKFSYRVENKTFERVFYAPSGYTTVKRGEYWGVLNIDGEEMYDIEYTYASPVNSKGEVYLINTARNAVYDSNGKVLALTQEQYMDTKAYNDGMLPIKLTDETWGFYNCDAQAVTLSGYDDVSSFNNGKAVVKNGSLWVMIDKNGNQVSDASFSDVKLFENGEYVYKNVMVAEQGDTYALYDENGKLVADLSATDADCYYGDYIAVMDSQGMWGYADKSGNIVIAPSYTAAKSFSNGLGFTYNGSKWGAINSELYNAIEYDFEYGGYFNKEGRCVVYDISDNYYFIKLRF